MGRIRGPRAFSGIARVVSPIAYLSLFNPLISPAALQSLLVVPRSPSPIPLEERDPETLTAEERLQLIRLMKEQKATAISMKQEVKRERQDDDDDDDDDEEITVVQSTNKRARTVASASNTIIISDD